MTTRCATKWCRFGPFCGDGDFSWILEIFAESLRISEGNCGGKQHHLALPKGVVQSTHFDVVE